MKTKSTAILLLALVGATISVRYDSQGSWGGVCNSGNGNKQSPIDIQDFKGACDNSIKLDLKLQSENNTFTVTSVDVADPGYIKATFATDVGSLYASDLSGNIFGYNLTEVRVHSPSEHNIESQSFAVEVQMFFLLRSEFGSRTINRAVLSLLFKESDDKKVGIDLLTTLSNTTAPQTAVAFTKMVKDILPSPLSYFTYEGSDTIPDCTENVLWYVVEKTIDVSASQVSVFTAKYSGNNDFAGGKGNNREIKDLASRVIKKGGVECEEQFIYFFSFVLLYAFINYFIFKLL